MIDVLEKAQQGQCDDVKTAIREWENASKYIDNIIISDVDVTVSSDKTASTVIFSGYNKDAEFKKEARETKQIATCEIDNDRTFWYLYVGNTTMVNSDGIEAVYSKLQYAITDAPDTATIKILQKGKAR